MLRGFRNKHFWVYSPLRVGGLEAESLMPKTLYPEVLSLVVIFITLNC